MFQHASQGIDPAGKQRLLYDRAVGVAGAWQIDLLQRKMCEMTLIQRLALFSIADDRVDERICLRQRIDRVDDLRMDAGIQRSLPLTGVDDIPQDQMMPQDDLFLLFICIDRHRKTRRQDRPEALVALTVILPAFQ